MSKFLLILRQILAWRSYIITLVTPLLLSLLFLYDGTEFEKPARCTYVLLILVVFWTTECVPIAVTALLPMFLYPLLKITTAKELAPKYMSEVNMAFVGSYIMVLAFENANLHKRFALRILLTVGAQPRWLLFGIMMSACFLSMFTNNTMSCALHLPIVKGIIDELREAARKGEAKHQSNQNNDGASTSNLAISAANSTSALVVENNFEKKIKSADLEDAYSPPAHVLSDKTGENIELRQIEQPRKKGILKVKTLRELPVDHPPPAEEVIVEEKLEQQENRLKSSSTVTLTQSGSSLETLPPAPSSSNPEEDGGGLSVKTIDGMEKMLLISAAYSASIGGMCTLIGTPTNLIMKERADQVYEAYNCTQPITFTSWLVIGFPVGYLFIFVAWFWLQIFFLGPRYVFDVWIIDPFRERFGSKTVVVSISKVRAARQAERITSVINQLYAQLDPMGFKQYAVVGHCIVLILLLVTRQMSTSESIGWDIIAPHYTKESTATILVSSFLFIFPSYLPSFRLAEHQKAAPPLLKWQNVDKEFPFGVILLLGGGMAAAAGAQDSGLPNVIAPVFGKLMQGVSLSLCVLLSSVLVASMTEFMSNVACVTLISPIMEKLAKDLGVSPLLFLFPTTLSSSFAFMFPVATPPNALVFSTNRLRIIDMVLCGIGMNIMGVFVVLLATTTWGNAYFNLYKPPCSE